MEFLRPDEAANQTRAAVFTPKAMRVQELRRQGMIFDEALAIADSEYSSDGLSLKPGAHAPATPAEVRA